MILAGQFPTTSTAGTTAARTGLAGGGEQGASAFAMLLGTMGGSGGGEESARQNSAGRLPAGVVSVPAGQMAVAGLPLRFDAVAAGDARRDLVSAPMAGRAAGAPDVLPEAMPESLPAPSTDTVSTSFAETLAEMGIGTLPAGVTAGGEVLTDGQAPAPETPQADAGPANAEDANAGDANTADRTGLLSGLIATAGKAAEALATTPAATAVAAAVLGPAAPLAGAAVAALGAQLADAAEGTSAQTGTNAQTGATAQTGTTSLAVTADAAGDLAALPQTDAADGDAPEALRGEALRGVAAAAMAVGADKETDAQAELAEVARNMAATARRGGETIATSAADARPASGPQQGGETAPAAAQPALRMTAADVPVTRPSPTGGPAETGVAPGAGQGPAQAGVVADATATTGEAARLQPQMQTPMPVQAATQAEARAPAPVPAQAEAPTQAGAQAPVCPGCVMMLAGRRPLGPWSL